MGPYERSLTEKPAAAGAPSATERRGGGRHRAPGRASRRSVRLVVLGLVAALVVGLGAFALLRPDDDGADAALACGPTRVPLTVAASPSLAPVLAKAAADFDSGTESLVDGRCTTTKVVATEPEAFGDTLRTALEAGGGANAPTAWMPDASIWSEVLSRRPELAKALSPSFPVVAVSPVVVAAPRPMAEALGWPVTQPSWAQLLELGRNPAGWATRGHADWGRARISWQDPLTDAASLSAMVSLTDGVVSQADTADATRRSLLQAQSALATLHADAEKVFAPLRDTTKPVAEVLRSASLLPTTEHAVRTFNASSPRVPLVALYPTDGIYPNEVPLITVRAGWVTPQQQAALDRFAVFIVSGQAAGQFAAAGWRTPRLETESDITDGAVASEPRYTPAGPSSWKLARALQGWTAVDRQGSVMVVLDTSGSMNERVAAAGNATRLDLAKQAISASLPLFSDRTNVGLWTFSRNDNRADYTSVLDLGPPSRTIGATPAMQVLQKSVAGLRADGATGLYDTVIAAADTAQRSWRPGDNTIILISDGKNEDPGSATLEQVLGRLRPLAGGDRPVRILSIALGGAADAATLRTFADVTRGEAYVARQAEDLDKVFLAALTD
ncbi:substrate-binding domain-containing protein [Humibacillus xanthopallidus]|nr:substrate-binding domain-containing protein [Humibacillus xanthopallidus]